MELATWDDRASLSLSIWLGAYPTILDTDNSTFLH